MPRVRGTEEPRRAGGPAPASWKRREALFDQALAWAREHGEHPQVDLGDLQPRGGRIELGARRRRGPPPARDPGPQRRPVHLPLAAYNISRHYELTKNFKKSLFYARIALDRAEVLGRRDWLASSHNLIGNTLLAESFIERPASEYEKAPRADAPPSRPPARGQILDNLGYCRVLQGAPPRGLPPTLREPAHAASASAPSGTRSRSVSTSASPTWRPAASGSPSGTAPPPSRWRRRWAITPRSRTRSTCSARSPT